MSRSARPPGDTIAQLGSTRSEVDLRGLGPQRTLALIDGRRLPSLPNPQGEFGQSDLNGVPLGAIDRMEILTSTSGGIYGPSAIGGVVNVVLRRDYRGADFNVIAGLADRGDARRVRFEARVGFTPDGGTTDIMLFAAYTKSSTLVLGQRDFADRARARAFANDPAGYLAAAPSSNAVRISSGGGDLVLDPAFGGASIGSPFTFLPVNFTGTAAERAAALAANAGKASLELAEDRSGAGRYLISNPTVTSGLFNIRRRLAPWLEAYADGLYFRNMGTTKANAIYVFPAIADAPTNPFQQFVTLRFPTSTFDQMVKTRTEIRRFSLGLIASLPGDWGATGDVTIGPRDRQPPGDLSRADGRSLFCDPHGPGPIGRPADGQSPRRLVDLRRGDPGLYRRPGHQHPAHQSLQRLVGAVGGTGHAAARRPADADHGRRGAPRAYPGFNGAAPLRRRRRERRPAAEDEAREVRLC